MARRLFHAVVLVGTGMGMACASRDAPTPVTDGATTSDTSTPADEGVDTFPGIMPMMTDTGTTPTDTATPKDSATPADTGTTDTFPTIAVDTAGLPG
jgi:hypothetical protein